ncbi:MAG: hypothetical protein IAE91_06250 [Ignavibacteriaceae bacterium]|nr:hypothetical protein [Ignavibacteriaceae bacterium]
MQESINETFTYNIFFKSIYRYLNIPVTILFLLYTFPLFVVPKIEFSVYFFATILLIAVALMNRFFFRTYKTVPYLIVADDNKLLLSDFFINRGVITVHYKDIVDFSGGFLDGRPNGLMKFKTSSGDEFGFYMRLNNSKKLITIILSKVNKEIYLSVLNKLGVKMEDVNKKTGQKK